MCLKAFHHMLHVLSLKLGAKCFTFDLACISFVFDSSNSDPPILYKEVLGSWNSKIILEQMAAKIVPIFLLVSYLSRIDILIFILHLCQVRWPHHSLSTPSMHLLEVHHSSWVPCSSSSMNASANSSKEKLRMKAHLHQVVSWA